MNVFFCKPNSVAYGGMKIHEFKIHFQPDNDSPFWVQNVALLSKKEQLLNADRTGTHHDKEKWV